MPTRMTKLTVGHSRPAKHAVLFGRVLFARLCRGVLTRWLGRDSDGGALPAGSVAE